MIEELLNDPLEGAAPTMKQLQPLFGPGVSLDAVTKPWCTRIARITFVEPWVYAPSPLGKLGYVLPVIDGGIIDLVGWFPRSGHIGTRLGIGACLGEGQIGRDGLGTTGMPLPVWRSPLEWLRSGRRGIVIADPQLAAVRLAGLAIVAEDAQHGDELRRTLSLPKPAILLRERETVREAA